MTCYKASNRTPRTKTITEAIIEKAQGEKAKTLFVFLNMVVMGCAQVNKITNHHKEMLHRYEFWHQKKVLDWLTKMTNICTFQITKL